MVDKEVKTKTLKAITPKLEIKKNKNLPKQYIKEMGF